NLGFPQGREPGHLRPHPHGQRQTPAVHGHHGLGRRGRRRLSAVGGDPRGPQPRGAAHRHPDHRPLLGGSHGAGLRPASGATAGRLPAATWPHGLSILARHGGRKAKTAWADELAQAVWHARRADASAQPALEAAMPASLFCSHSGWRRAARLTAEITPSREAVTMLPLRPTPNNTRSGLPKPIST